MNFDPTPKQSLLIWSLLITRQEPAISKLKPEMSPAERKPLIDHHLIQLEKRGRTTHVVLTDRAWDWACSNFHVQFPKSIHVVPVFEQFLAIVGNHLESHKLSIADLLSTPKQVSLTLENRIRDAYLNISGGKYYERVRISNLRKLLGDIPRKDVDSTLIKMGLADQLVLMGFDDPLETKSEDMENALTVAGQQKYLIYMIER